MGGERETTVKASKASKASKTEQTIGDVRIHEEKGEVHFHLDELGLKVAVPVPRWFAAWEKLHTEPGHWRFYDAKRNCLLEVSTGIQQGDMIMVDLSISKVKTTSDFAAVDKFTNG